jgi:hypothetical protein
LGPEANTPVWLVRDADTLHVDRNGNGDLTEKGEAIAARPKEKKLEFGIGDVADPSGRRYTELAVSFTDGSATMMGFAADRRFFVDGVPDGELQFAPRAADAPVIHIGGPLTFALAAPKALARGDEDASIAIVLGTPGLGRGSFTYLLYRDEMIPNFARPVGEIEFQSRLGGKGARAKLTLKRRT